MLILQSSFGLFTLTILAWILSEDRAQVRPPDIIAGLVLQILLAVILLKIPYSLTFFELLNKMVTSLQDATNAGSSFVFGYLGGGAIPFKETFPGASFILAFQALPLILVISALSSLLFYWRIIPGVVTIISRGLQKTLHIGGALGVGVAANIFVGMIEAPLFIRPYLTKMTRSELFTVMTCGMATIAGTVMVLYATILKDAIPGAMGHILVASIISAPAAITVSRIMVPEKEKATDGKIVPSQTAASPMDAITTGTASGVGLLINILAMLVVLVALVHLTNQILGIFPDISGEPVTLQRLLGLFMAPVTWLMGVPWSEAGTAGSLMGIKTVLNEFLAYLELAQTPPETLSPRSVLIMTYAMCGFANFGSLGIMIGGLVSMAPERRKDIVSFGIRSIAAGTIATCMTGAVVGILTP